MPDSPYGRGHPHFSPQKIKVTRSNLGSIETGRINATSRVIGDICEAFKINEHWLRTGEGPMEAPTQIKSVAELLKSTFDSLDSYDKQVIEAWLKATPEDRAALKRLFNTLKSLQETEAAQRELSATLAIRPAAADKQLTRAEKEAIMKHQLDAEEKAVISSASIGISSTEK